MAIHLVKDCIFISLWLDIKNNLEYTKSRNLRNKNMQGKEFNEQKIEKIEEKQSNFCVIIAKKQNIIAFLY